MSAEASVQVSDSTDNVIGQDHLAHADSNTGIEIMISQLLKAHQLKTGEMYR